MSNLDNDPLSELEQGQGGPALETEDVKSEAAKAAPGAVPVAKRGMIYTMTAAQGVNSAEIINAAMAKKTLGKATPRRVVVAAPDGPSTSGGKHARQTITMVPVSGQGGTVMCGWLDVAKKEAGLRDFRSVADQYKGRYGMNLDITADEYLGVVRELEGLLKTVGITAAHEVTEPVKKAAQVAQQMTEPEQPESQTNPMTVVIAVTLLAIAAVVVGIVFLR